MLDVSDGVTLSSIVGREVASSAIEKLEWQRIWDCTALC
jgi:hypothetical protein